MPNRPLTEKIPEYLHPYIVHQDASLYTPIDHASWRFILKISQAFFSKYAHQKYLDGLRETGISTERIPLIEEMDQCLRKFNWRAVAVSGFIPPAVFMEFLSRGVLPIACDMRKLEHLSYTPAPDIVHEAAGHAPIIADPEYAEYLRQYGELAEKAIFSSQDLDVYNAVRNLSVVKEDPRATEAEIAGAQKQLDDAVAAVDHDSEATQLGRMGWWTIEYGLIGDFDRPKIYGAGLLSSVGESYNCLKPEVKKIPFSVDCIHMSYDITRPQPQLYVAPDFHALTRGLHEFANMMAYRRGGREGLEKAAKAHTTTTAVLDSGIQISGTLAKFTLDPAGAPFYLKYEGPTQLSFQGVELESQGPDYHKEGFSTVIGPLRGPSLRKDCSTAELSTADLEGMGFKPGSKGRMEFASGVTLEGTLVSKVERNGKNLILVFEDCQVRLGSETLFDPAWGRFDLACGATVGSVFGGAADQRKYLAATGGFKQKPGKQKTNLTPENQALNQLYARVRKIRESAPASAPLEPESMKALAGIHQTLEEAHRDDWLLRYELLELDAKYGMKSPWTQKARQRLDEIGKTARDKAEMISRGLELL